MINYLQKSDKLWLDVGASKVAGQAVLVGASLVGVCLQAGDSGNDTVIATEGIFDLSVTAVNNGGNSAVAIGDKIYIESGTLNKDSVDGVLFGKALETVTSGATATIKVMLIQA